MKIWNILKKYICVVIFLILLLVFVIATNGAILKASNLKSIINQTITTIMCGLGLIFVIAIGGTDISMGSMLAFAGALCAVAGKRIGFWAVFPTAILVSGAGGVLLGFVNTRLKVSSFMVSLSMLIALRGAANWVISNNVVIAGAPFRALDSWGIKIPVLIGMIIIMWYVFEYTPYGQRCKAIGENENAMLHAGFNVKRMKMIAFILCGVMTGITAVFNVARMGGTSVFIGAGFEMRVLIAMYMAGIPVDGGSGTRMYKFLVGAFTVNMLENGLTMCNVNSSVVQGIRGLVLLGVVLLTTYLVAFSDGTGRKSKQIDRSGAARE